MTVYCLALYVYKIAVDIPPNLKEHHHNHWGTHVALPAAPNFHTKLAKCNRWFELPSRHWFTFIFTVVTHTS